MREILKKIVEHKRLEVAARKKTSDLAAIKASEIYSRTCNSLVTELQESTSNGIIAEFKRKSPSKSDINLTADLSTVLAVYNSCKVSAFSILTDEHFFGGSDTYLAQARESFPYMSLLRKEFIIDTYQVHETKSLGADVLLLIAEILSEQEIEELTLLAKSIGLEVLLEIHSEEQIEKIPSEISMIGVNNRDLNTFQIDYNRSKHLLRSLPDDKPKIAESGLSDPMILADLYKSGFCGFLVGEHFMRMSDLPNQMSDFVNTYMQAR